MCKSLCTVQLAMHNTTTINLELKAFPFNEEELASEMSYIFLHTCFSFLFWQLEMFQKYSLFLVLSIYTTVTM